MEKFLQILEHFTNNCRKRLAPQKINQLSKLPQQILEFFPYFAKTYPGGQKRICEGTLTWKTLPILLQREAFTSKNIGHTTLNWHTWALMGTVHIWWRHNNIQYVGTVPDMSTDAPARISMKIKTIIDNKNLKCSSSFPFNPFHSSLNSLSLS